MRKHLGALLTLGGIIAGVVSTSPTVASAATAPIADPSIGPHTRDEARHQHDQLHFAPASSPIVPRRARAAAPAAPGAAPASVGNLSREVFAFAPYWALSSGAQANWKYNLVSPFAFFVMAYDMAFSNSPGQAGPNAPMNGWTYNDSLSVSQYKGKAPASKIILGVPYYGYA